MKNDAKFKIRDSKLHNSLVVPVEIYPNIISEISDFVHLRGLALWATAPAHEGARHMASNKNPHSLSGVRIVVLRNGVITTAAPGVTTA
jgi:hypothetical protein